MLPQKIESILDELIIELEKKDLLSIKDMQETELYRLHFGLGMYIRNKYNFWEDYELVQQLEVFHADDASAKIIQLLQQKLQNIYKPYENNQLKNILFAISFLNSADINSEDYPQKIDFLISTLKNVDFFIAFNKERVIQNLQKIDHLDHFDIKEAVSYFLDNNLSNAINDFTLFKLFERFKQLYYKQMKVLKDFFIPHGSYCYNFNFQDQEYRCPFLDEKENLPTQENGYCHYLQKSDWDINNESEDSLYAVYIKNHPECVGKKYSECIKTDDIVDENGRRCDIAFSFLWDEVKECNINREESIEPCTQLEILYTQLQKDNNKENFLRFSIELYAIKNEYTDSHFRYYELFFNLAKQYASIHEELHIILFHASKETPFTQKAISLMHHLIKSHFYIFETLEKTLDESIYFITHFMQYIPKIAKKDKEELIEAYTKNVSRIDHLSNEELENTLITQRTTIEYFPRSIPKVKSADAILIDFYAGLPDSDIKKILLQSVYNFALLNQDNELSPDFTD